MKILAMSPNLSSQVHAALVAEIAEGRLTPGARIIQEQIAQRLGVSRQPVQQALLLLRDQGVLDDAPRRGLIVAPIDPDHVRHMYDIRAMVEGLAFRRAAEHSAPLAQRLGASLLREGRKAVEEGSTPKLIAADLAFHRLIHELSRNPLISPTLNTQWTCIQRVMGEVLMRDETPDSIWAQHEEMLDAVIAADGDAAERLARDHITRAADIAIERLNRVPGATVVQRSRITRSTRPSGFAADPPG
jgi:DNA-binding GntR family transcriptional regulator